MKSTVVGGATEAICVRLRFACVSILASFSSSYFEPPGTTPGEREISEARSGSVAVSLRHLCLCVRSFSSAWATALTSRARWCVHLVHDFCF